MIQKFVIVFYKEEEITEAQLGGKIMDAFNLNLIRVEKEDGTPVPAYFRRIAAYDLTDEDES